MSTEILHKATKKALVPQLRFPEFEEYWKEAIIEELFDFKNGLNKEKEFFGKGTPIINFMDVYKLNSIKKNDVKGLVELSKSEIERYSAKKGDIFFTRTSETIVDIGMSATLVESIENCVFSGFVLRARAKSNIFDSHFTSYLFSTESIRKEITTKSSMTTRALTSGTLLNKVNFSYPNNKIEQQKIASFLSAVDEKIQQLTRKRELLEQYKKGVMQQLFSGELRFKDDKGKDFPEWEEKKLGDLVTLMQSGISRMLSDTDIGLPIIRSNNLQNGRIDITEIKYWFEIDNQGANLDNYVLSEGDLLVNFINSIAQIGKVAMFSDVLKRKTIFTTNLLRLRFKDLITSYFMMNYFHLKKYEDFIQSITKPAVNQASFTTKDFKTFIVNLPSLPEQKKIADFLSSIDVKIENVNQQVTQAKNFKKGLLQQLFV